MGVSDPTESGSWQKLCAWRVSVWETVTKESSKVSIRTTPDVVRVRVFVMFIIVPPKV